MRVLPFRGAYRVLRRPELVRALVYPVPDPSLPFLGVHLTRGIDGEVHVGPTALLALARDAYRLRRVADARHVLGWPGTYRMARRWWRTAATEVAHAAVPAALAARRRGVRPRAAPGRPRCPARPASAVRPWPATGRCSTTSSSTRPTARLHVRNAPSPAATACLALAEVIADRA